MSRAIHFIAKSVPGHGPPDGTGLPCQGVSGRAVCLTPYPSRGSNKNSAKIKHLRCTVRNTSPVCSASSGGHRRNPDFSRQNKHGFSRNRNRQNEDREGFDSLEESEMFSSKNGPLLTTSGIPRFQATATPGPREKEIVELFRKVQAQLRKRAAVKEERKIEESQRKGKESETVDSLLKLLRKHSVQQGKRSSDIDSGRDFILDQPEQNSSFSQEKNTVIYDSNHSVKHEKRESEAPVMSRPRSNFQRRSPVPLVKNEPVFSDEDAMSSVSRASTVQEGKKKSLEPEFGVGPDIESDTEATFSDGDEFDEMSEDEISGIYDDDNENVQEPDADEYSNLSEMKLIELRALAKSRGLRGFSKLKKHELIELLSGG
ncbi:rho-N domain-containing protein 1, chloroplastic [Coffea eugenioides]|uniref:rho-N domain-containing protein 1, chloroplastic n=1 Tax=Coffea eugenioides TaxID=49369 RepID=UPI000F613786|nr:rho-N domain-containing protein 1, chloroplastic [Coffea eugenioides]